MSWTYTQLLQGHIPEQVWVVYLHPDGKFYDFEPVVLVFEDKVGIIGDYHHPVGWQGSPLDNDGQCLVYIPRSEVLYLYSEEEAHQAMELRDIDQKLLSYAR